MCVCPCVCVCHITLPKNWLTFTELWWKSITLWDPPQNPREKILPAAYTICSTKNRVSRITNLLIPQIWVHLRSQQYFILPRNSLAFFKLMSKIFLPSSQQTRRNQSTVLHRIPLRHTLILSSYIHLGIASGAFLWVLPTKILYTFLFSTTTTTYHAHHIVLTLRLTLNHALLLLLLSS